MNWKRENPEQMEADLIAFLSRPKSSQTCIGESEQKGRNYEPKCPRHGVSLRFSSVGSYRHYHCPVGDLWDELKRMMKEKKS